MVQMVPENLERLVYNETRGGAAMTIKYLLRLPVEVHRQAVILAQADGRSLNGWIIRVLQKAVQGKTPHTAKTPPPP